MSIEIDAIDENGVLKLNQSLLLKEQQRVKVVIEATTTDARRSYGIIGVTNSGIVSVPGVKVDVVDTVGAGDTVGAIIVEAIVEKGINALVGDTLRQVLVRATKAAGVTCSRAGANPPTKAEIH